MSCDARRHSLSIRKRVDDQDLSQTERGHWARMVNGGFSPKKRPFPDRGVACLRRSIRRSTRAIGWMGVTMEPSAVPRR